MAKGRVAKGEDRIGHADTDDTGDTDARDRGFVTETIPIPRHGGPALPSRWQLTRDFKCNSSVLATELDTELDQRRLRLQVVLSFPLRCASSKSSSALWRSPCGRLDGSIMSPRMRTTSLVISPPVRGRIVSRLSRTIWRRPF